MLSFYSILLLISLISTAVIVYTAVEAARMQKKLKDTLRHSSSGPVKENSFSEDNKSITLTRENYHTCLDLLEAQSDELVSLAKAVKDMPINKKKKKEMLTNIADALMHLGEMMNCLAPNGALQKIHAEMMEAIKEELAKAKGK